MTIRIRLLAMALAGALAELAALAQGGDATYCKALSEKYETYLANCWMRRIAETGLGRRR